jgi:hypothetical protein
MIAVNPEASRQAVVQAALVMLERMGLIPVDLAAVPPLRTPVPTFAEYVPIVSAAVSAETRRAYGSYWNRVVEHWGGRRLDEPTPSEIRQLMAYVKTHVVALRNARGGRSAEEHLVAALRCVYQRAVDDGLMPRRTTRRGKWPSRGACRPPGGRCRIPDWRTSTKSPQPQVMTRNWTRCCCGCTLRPPADAAARSRCARETWMRSSA